MKSCNDPGKGYLYPGRRFYGGRWRTLEQIERFRQRVVEYRNENLEACNATVRRRCREHKRRMDELKDCCRGCGYNDPRALDFHHRDPASKTFTIGGAGRSWSWTRIETEIAKCDVLCANCHRILHAEETSVAALIPPRGRRIYVPNPGVDTGSLH